jgi:hypothetical protein
MTLLALGAKFGTPPSVEKFSDIEELLKRSGINNDPKATLPNPRLNFDRNLLLF